MKKTSKDKKPVLSPEKNKRGNQLKSVLTWMTPILVLLFALLMTIGQNPDFLWKLQDLDLFAFDKQFLLDQLSKVGGLSMYLASFLNQFFFHPWLGTLVFVALILLIGVLTAKAFGLKGWAFPLAFIPTVALLWCMTELGYMIYCIKVDGYVFNNILGVLFLLSGVMIFKKIEKLRFRAVFTVGYLMIGYPFCGAFALFAGLLMLLDTLIRFSKESKRTSIFYVSAMALALVLIPVFYYRCVFEQLAFGDIYTANLPYFTFKSSEVKLWFPFLTLACCFFVFVFLKPPKQETIWSKSTPITLLFIVGSLVSVFSYKDHNFNTEISMLRATDDENWQHVLQIAGAQKEEPSRLIVMATNLALIKLGMAGDHMFQYKNGDKEIVSPRFIVPIHIAGSTFYYQYGIPTYCTKWCMEGLVEYSLSISVLKYSVLSALLNNDFALAKKYNDVLLSTFYHRSWALKHQQYIDHPETIVGAQEFQDILPLTAFKDELNEDYYNLESFLRIHFSTMTEVPNELTELSVLYNMDIKDDKRFWPRLFRWVKLNPGKRIPVHFQEAALLFADLTKMDISGAPFDGSVVASFKIFLEMVQRYGNYPESAMKELFAPQFGKTYWYYYFFMKGPQSDSKQKPVYKN